MKFQNALELILLGAIWGASFLFMRVAVPEFGPLALIEVRVAIAAVFLVALLAARGELKKLRGHFWQFLVLGAINSAIPFSLFAYTTLTLTAGFSAVLNSTAPLVGVILAYLWFHERLPAIRMLGLVIGFVGVVILAWSKLSLQGDLVAIGAGLLAAVLYGVAAHFSRRNFQGVPPLAVAAGSQIAASILLFPLMIASWPRQLPSLLSWMCAVALGILCTGIAYVLYFRSLRNLGASRAMTVAYLIPAFGILWGFLFLGEPITLNMLFGGFVVLIGTTIVNRTAKATANP